MWFQQYDMTQIDDNIVVQRILDEMQAPPEAMDDYPDECANCGADADPFWVPDDYHQRPADERDPGTCTECGHHFGGDGE